MTGQPYWHEGKPRNPQAEWVEGRYVPNTPPRFPHATPRPRGRAWTNLSRRIRYGTLYPIACELCDQLILGPWEASVDHRTPLAQGGAAWALSNLRIVHRACNSREGAILGNSMRGPTWRPRRRRRRPAIY